MAKRTSMVRLHKVRRINRTWCVGYWCGGYWHLMEREKTRSEANETADRFDDAINWGLM